MRRFRPFGLGLAVGLATAAGCGGWLGLLAGLGLGITAAVAGRRVERVGALKRSRVERRVAADLPFACDLLASALRAGLAPEAALRCVGEAIGGPLGARLDQVERALRLGADAEQAWSYLGPGAATGRIAQAAACTQHSGAALASALVRVAEDLRADHLVAIEAAARRAGVLLALPLGLCFLPAFVLAGLVPVIVAVLSDALSP